MSEVRAYYLIQRGGKYIILIENLLFWFRQAEVHPHLYQTSLAENIVYLLSQSTNNMTDTLPDHYDAFIITGPIKHAFIDMCKGKLFFKAGLFVKISCLIF